MAAPGGIFTPPGALFPMRTIHFPKWLPVALVGLVAIIAAGVLLLVADSRTRSKQDAQELEEAQELERSMREMDKKIPPAVKPPQI